MSEAQPPSWSRLTKDKFSGAFDILAAMERTGITLPTSTGLLLRGLVRDTLDCAEQVLADARIWRSLPDQLDMGRVFKREEVRQRLADIVTSAW